MAPRIEGAVDLERRPAPVVRDGVLDEVLVCAELVKRGWHAFAPITGYNAPVDLVAVRDGVPALRIEVKRSRRTPRNGGGWVYSNSPHWGKNGCYDHVAFVLADEGSTVVFVPELP